MKTSRRSFPWTIIATAAVAGASFVGIASYVNGNRTKPLVSDEAPISVTDVTPATSAGSTGGKGQKNENGSEHRDLVSSDHVTTGDLNRAVKGKGLDNARVIGLDVENGTAVVDMNSAIIDSLGSTGEAELIESLRTALSKDKRVKNFQIRVDGEIQKTLGHTDLSSPVSVR
ncbi:MAG: hypothetical protein WCK51_13525 [Armatimonadota bacterium]